MIEPAYYQNKISSFLAANQDQILGELTNKHSFAVDLKQKNAWIEQIQSLKDQLCDFLDDNIFLEFAIPRMGKRTDVVLIIRGIVYVIEYKIGAEAHETHAIDQVTDYALDLKNFHEGSHCKYVVPILVSTRSPSENSSAGLLNSLETK
jgi:hypothetical protein